MMKYLAGDDKHPYPDHDEEHIQQSESTIRAVCSLDSRISARGTGSSRTNSEYSKHPSFLDRDGADDSARPHHRAGEHDSFETRTPGLIVGSSTILTSQPISP